MYNFNEVRAVPFAAANSFRVISYIMLGSMVASVVAMIGGVANHAPHGSACTARTNIPGRELGWPLSSVLSVDTEAEFGLRRLKARELHFYFVLEVTTVLANADSSYLQRAAIRDTRPPFLSTTQCSM